MKNSCRVFDAFSPRKLTRAGSQTLVAACALAAVPVLATDKADIAVEHEADRNQSSGEQANPYGDFLLKYIDWATSIEVEGQKRGAPLSSDQAELAAQLGIKYPEKVRIVFVETVPFPTEDAEMRKIGEGLGFIGPGVTNNAQAFGYTIWVRNGFTLDRPRLAHELVHVQQIERSSSFGAYVVQYMQELLEYGHADMPLEVEAYQANQAYASGGTSNHGAEEHRDHH